jgi:uncharacterized protein
MAAYLDTSFLVPLFFHETASTAVLDRARSESELWISHWTLAEFSSAVAFKLRTGQTDENTSRQATARLQSILNAQGLIVAEVRATDFERAAQFCAAYASSLRTPDALHAAIAARLNLTLLTCDKGLAQGCRYHGIGHECIGLS